MGATKTIFINDTGDSANQSFTMNTVVDTTGLVNLAGEAVGQLIGTALGANGNTCWDSTTTDVTVNLGGGNNVLSPLMGPSPTTRSLSTEVPATSNTR